MTILYKESADLLCIENITQLYNSVKWSSANKPEILLNSLQNSDIVITAWDKNTLIGLGNAISDGCLVAYFPHLLIKPDYQGKGIGKEIMNKLLKKYQGFHQLMVVADSQAISFYEKCGFAKAGNTQSMWVYEGEEH